VDPDGKEGVQAGSEGRGGMSETIVLGAGPAGLGAAFRLTRRDSGRVTVLEQRHVVGGNAGSFEISGIAVDYGSHRLHPACDEGILHDLRRLLGEDLLLRPRHGRIRLRERWIHFPLEIGDLTRSLPLSFCAGVAGDLLRRQFIRNGQDGASFAAVLERGLGATMCREFYFPYARKIWGVEPEELSAIQARKRVSGGTPGKMLRKLAGRIPGFRTPGAGKFYYPRRGYGQICEALAEAVRAAGGQVAVGAGVTCLERRGGEWVVGFEREGEHCEARAARVWSTLPATLLPAIVTPEAPQEVRTAAERIGFRSLILIYLVLEQDRFTPFDAHYFPDSAVPLARLSEPKNYAAAREPRGITVLCGELPCACDSEVWRATDAEIAERMLDWLAAAGLPVRSRVRAVETRRLAHAYPLYRRGYEEHWGRIDRWLDGMEGLITFGRQGLFAHDNLHHALAMGYGLADCLGQDGRFDRTRWCELRRQFEEHVVED
jgi:protoporphyrinogen oxidase